MTARDLPLAILAGGLATRLGPAASDRPKALVEVAGRPFLDHQLALAGRWGVRRVVVCAGHRGRMIEEHLAAAPAAGLDVRCAHDGGRLLGTAGALRAAADALGPWFFVLYGDSYLDPAPPLDVLAAGLRPGDLGLVTACPAVPGSPNLLYDRGRAMAHDKERPRPEMAHADWGLSLLAREAVEGAPAGAPSDLGALFAALAAEGRLAAHEVRERFYEIGSPEGLAETRARLEAP
jgi:NDP-sugar pyrophosphorylase family protein